MSETRQAKFVRIVKQDEELQLVYAEVYVPDIPDVDKEFMTRDEIRKMAHKFLASGKVNKVDTIHDNTATSCRVVESFIARDGDPDFIPGSWVAGVHIPDVNLWDKVKKGELNGFSMEALVIKTPRELELEIPEYLVGETDVAEGHCHTFKVEYSDDGTFLGGSTDEVDGHVHKILRGTATETNLEHNHRFSFVELMQ